MKVKRMVKRLFAVGTGVAMLGATAMGALAADLKEYPNMFLTDGTFNGFFVVGEKAASVDNLAMTDIAAGMKYVKPSGKATTSVSGDAWMVGTSAKKLEMVNNNATASSLAGETFRDITTFIGDEELKALGDGTWSTNENEYGYQQFMFFDALPSGDTGGSPTRIAVFNEDDNDETTDHLFFRNGRQLSRYRLEFTSTAQSDVTDSSGSADTTGTYLDDFENTELSLFGKPYTVVLARRPDSTPQNSVRLIMMAGSTRDTLLEGEAKTYTVASKTYDVSLSFVDSDEAKFTVNGESTNKLKVGETYVLSDKSEIGVSEILYQDYAGGVHSVTFFVGAQKVELRDDDVTIDSGSYNMKVGSEDIDGTTVIVTGTDNNSTFTISTIELNMSAEDDYFVGAGEKLSDVVAASGEEKEVLLAGSYDVEYKGLSAEDTHDIGLKSSSARRYRLSLFDGDNNKVDIPLLYAESQYNFSLGEDTQVSTARAGQKRLILNESPSVAPLAGPAETASVGSTSIYKDDYFVVTGGTASDGSAKSYLMQYKGADRQTKTSPKIKFKNTGSAESLEYSVSTVSAGTTGTVATIKIGGYSFIAQNASTMESDDFQVNVDLNGDGTFTAGASFITFVDSYGSQWSVFNNATQAVSGGDSALTVGNINGSSGLPDVYYVSYATPNGDDYDNFIPSAINLTITGASGPELRAAQAGTTLLTPDGETEVAYGYTTMGTYIKFTSPSSDPNELTLSYPKNQRLPQVYFTSGATTSTTTAAGDLAKVEVVDATKLDSEIADVKAQNLIVVGGPCVNTVAAELLGNPTECTEGFTPGKARVKLFSNGDKVAMLVAGYSGADTRLAGKVIAHRWKELSGSEVEVEGTTYSDATIGAPTAKVASTETATAE